MSLDGKSPVNFKQGEWSEWETCSVTCGGGIQERKRATTQETLFNGNEYTWDEKETQACNNNDCPGKYFSNIL